MKLLFVNTTGKHIDLQQRFALFTANWNRMSNAPALEIYPISMSITPEVYNGLITPSYLKWLKDSQGEYDTIMVLISKRDRRRFKLSAKYNGHHTSGMMYVIADNNSTFKRKKRRLDQLGFIGLHEISHFVAWKTQSLDNTHYLDYEKEDIESVFPMYRW